MTCKGEGGGRYHKGLLTHNKNYIIFYLLASSLLAHWKYCNHPLSPVIFWESSHFQIRSSVFLKDLIVHHSESTSTVCHTNLVPVMLQIVLFSHQTQQNTQLSMKNSGLGLSTMYLPFFFQPSLTQPLKSVSTCDDNVFELVKLDPHRRSYRAHFRLIKHYGKYILITYQLTANCTWNHNHIGFDLLQAVKKN